MRFTLRALLALLIAGSLHAPAATPQETTRPAFTLRSRLTIHSDGGEKVVLDEVRHVSSNGNLRLVTTREDGSASADKFYVRGRGLFLVSHQYKMLRRWREPLPDAADAPAPAAEQLRASPNFVRTETVLGRETYLHRLKDEKTAQPAYDYYFTPELGRTPLRSVEYRDGKVREVSEPVGVTFGEPEAAQVEPPPYEEVENFPVSGGVLNGKAVEKPAPAYPAIVNAKQAEGVVVVQVMVDEAGRVVSARAVGGHPVLRHAAVEAAYRARFSPTLLSGKPVKVTGTLTYEFKQR